VPDFDAGPRALEHADRIAIAQKSRTSAVAHRRMLAGKPESRCDVLRTGGKNRNLQKLCPQPQKIFESAEFIRKCCRFMIWKA
jgi:hypothetical protein